MSTRKWRLTTAPSDRRLPARPPNRGPEAETKLLPRRRIELRRARIPTPRRRSSPPPESGHLSHPPRNAAALRAADPGCILHPELPPCAVGQRRSQVAGAERATSPHRIPVAGLSIFEKKPRFGSLLYTAIRIYANTRLIWIATINLDPNICKYPPRMDRVY
jgi:hypothetical protein